MPLEARYILLAAAAWIVGSVPFGWLLARTIKGVNILETGSGSTGATNASRALGTKYFFVVLFLDFLKGAGSVSTGLFIFEDVTLGVLMGAAAILGHMYSVFLRFRGGKGVATGLGVCGFLLPVPTGIALAVFLVVFASFRFISLGSICASAALAASYFAMNVSGAFEETALAVFALAVPVMVIFKHRTNVKRLLNGEEPKFGRPETKQA